MDILFLIDKLEKLVQQSTKVPALNLRVVNESEILDVIDQLRTSVPEEVKAARQIQGQKDRVIAQGKEEAERIVVLARKQAEELLTAHEIARSAEGRSHTIIERAQRDAADIRKGADDYAQQVLSGLDQRVGQAHHQIRSGLIELEQRLNAGAEPANYETSEPPSNPLPSKEGLKRDLEGLPPAPTSESKASGKAAEVLKFPSNKP